MVNKSIKLKNIINIWFQVIFYSLLFTALRFFFFPESRTAKNSMIAILPVVGKQWWYISSYFLLFFFIPFLNKAVNNISQQTHKKLLILILIAVCCLGTIIPSFSFLLNNGYSAIWLMIVYLFGAYIRKYDVHKKITALKSLLGFFAMVIFSFVSKIGIHFLTNPIFGEAKFENMLISYTSITVLMSAIFLHLFCLNLKINHTTAKIILFFSPATLGVYLIHVHPLIFKHIMKDAFISFIDKSVIIMILYVFVATLSIYVVCSMIDLLRIHFFQLIKISKICAIIANKADAFYIKVFKK